jgi:hypothetical protein
MKQMPPVEQLPLVNRRFEQVFHRDHRACTCEMPMVSRKWNDALGTFVGVRLCCAAKAVEKIAAHLGLDVGKLYEVFDFDPKWVWDCNELHQSASDGDNVEMVPRGAPPAWLLKRMQEKGIEIRNLPPELETNR